MIGGLRGVRAGMDGGSSGGSPMAEGRATDVRIKDVEIDFESHAYRAPIKFGGNVVRDVVVLNVAMTVENRAGQVATGLGSMPLGNVWAFPPHKVGAADSLVAMRELAHRVADVTRDCSATGHPVDLMVALEPLYLEEAERLSRERNLAEPLPKLATLVVGSPFDAAAFDAFGKAAGIHAFHGLSADFMSRDLSAYLNDEFRGRYLDRYVADAPKTTTPLYHLAGALDPLTAGENPEPLADGWPETLDDWIAADGLTHLKIKLNGDDLDWDVDRVVAVDAVAAEAQRRRGQASWVYSLDFNERAESVEYLITCLERIRERAAAAFDRIAYIEQPTARDLKAHPENKMHKAAEIKPVVIDESLVDFESLLLAREQGYTGVALKACKGQSQSLLMAAAAQHYRMFLCVQDLTCPGRSFVHSAGLAAWIPPVTAIEGNSRQYCPGANEGWRQRLPDVFTVKEGAIRTAGLTAPGLGIEE
jgi:L-alanine-DL-glutamate epimerase-like enolase superfamily enzyme